MTAPSSSLCFHEASQKFKEKEINEEEYYHNILAHCMGYLHDEDDDVPWPSLSVSSLEWDDPFAFAVECFMKRKDFVTDIAPFEDSFKAIANQDVRAIEEATTRLQDQHANFLRKILALRALQLRKAEVLKYCLDLGGFPYEAYFEDEADTVREEDDPLVFKILEESHFRKLYPRSEKNLARQKADDDEDNMLEGDGLSAMGSEERENREREEIAATFDRGGNFPVNW